MSTSLAIVVSWMPFLCMAATLPPVLALLRLPFAVFAIFAVFAFPFSTFACWKVDKAGSLQLVLFIFILSCSFNEMGTVDMFSLC